MKRNKPTPTTIPVIKNGVIVDMIAAPDHNVKNKKRPWYKDSDYADVYLSASEGMAYLVYGAVKLIKFIIKILVQAIN